MTFTTPPYLSQNVSVQRVMLQVLAALLPAIAVYVWLLGPAVLVQLDCTTLLLPRQVATVHDTGSLLVIDHDVLESGKVSS